MKKMAVVLGESGSGKTTLIARLVKDYPHLFKKVVTCTSRPMRANEIDGTDYHFLPPEYFVANASELVLGKRTMDGHYYATKKADLHSDTHHLLITSKPTGVQRLLGLGIRNIVIVNITITEALKIQRMCSRGDSESMIAARLQSDREIKQPETHLDVPSIDIDAAATIEANAKLTKEFIAGV